MLHILASLLAATADKPGTHDYPLIQRFPGQLISNENDRDWDSARFDVKGAPSVTLEGRKVELWYELPKEVEKPSRLEWQRNYENALTGAGWKIDLGREGFVSAHLDKDGREIRALLTYGGG